MSKEMEIYVTLDSQLYIVKQDEEIIIGEETSLENILSVILKISSLVDISIIYDHEDSLYQLKDVLASSNVIIVNQKWDPELSIEYMVDSLLQEDTLNHKRQRFIKVFFALLGVLVGLVISMPIFQKVRDLSNIYYQYNQSTLESVVSIPTMQEDYSTLLDNFLNTYYPNIIFYYDMSHDRKMEIRFSSGKEITDSRELDGATNLTLEFIEMDKEKYIYLLKGELE